MLDGGDELFAASDPGTDREAARARLVMDGLGTIGVDAMAVGERDLSRGLPFLMELASHAKVPLLAANLTGPDGKKPLPASRMLTADGVQVGVVGVTALPADTGLPAGLTLGDPERAVRDEAAALREKGATLVVALVHAPAAVAESIARISGIDLVATAHEGSLRPPYAIGDAFVVAGGMRGRFVRSFTVDMSAKGKLVDGDVAKRADSEVQYLTGRIADARERASKATTDAEKVSFGRAAADLQKRMDEVKRTAGTAAAAGGRRFTSDAVQLGSEWPDEPALAAAVKAFETKYPPPPPSEH